MPFLGRVKGCRGRGLPVIGTLSHLLLVRVGKRSRSWSFAHRGKTRPPQARHTGDGNTVVEIVRLVPTSPTEYRTDTG